MRTTSCWRLLGLVTVLALVGGCTGTADPSGTVVEEDGDATSPGAADPPSAATDSDPLIAQVDEAYVDRVVNALLWDPTATLRGVVEWDEETDLTEEEIEAMALLSPGPSARFPDDAYPYGSEPEGTEEPRSANASRGPEVTLWVTERLVHADPGCIVAVGLHDREGRIESRPNDWPATVVSLIRREAHTREVDGDWWLRDLSLIRAADGTIIERDRWEEVDYALLVEHACVSTDWS